MVTRFAIPFLILAVLFLPLPFILGVCFCVLLAVRPRGRPVRVGVFVPWRAAPTLLRSPPA